jgi:hypothetical protein
MNWKIFLQAIQNRPRDACVSRAAVWTALLYSMANDCWNTLPSFDVMASQPSRKLQITISFYFPTYHNILRHYNDNYSCYVVLINQIQITNSAIICLPALWRRHVFSESCSVNYNDNLRFLVTRVCVAFLFALTEQMNSTGPLPEPLGCLLRAKVKYILHSRFPRQFFLPTSLCLKNKIGLWHHLNVCLCIPPLFSFSIRSVSYQRKVRNEFSPELLV